MAKKKHPFAAVRARNEKGEYVGDNPETPTDEAYEYPHIPSSVLDAIARVCHEANRAYCESLGDDSQVPWDEAPGEIRASARNGVKHALRHPDSTPSDSHANWVKDKKAAGWEYGAVKDFEAKTHPCIVPYNKLPAAQRRKDALFLAIVRALE